MGAESDKVFQLLNKFGSNKQTTTQTSGSNISDQGMNELLQQILSGNQGLASIAGGQKSAGLYNSTVNQQLTNDLITQASAKAAAARAGTTTTTTVQGPKASGIEQLLSGLQLGKGALGTLTKSPLIKKSAADAAMTPITDLSVPFDSLGGSAFSGTVGSSAASGSMFDLGSNALGLGELSAGADIASLFSGTSLGLEAGASALGSLGLSVGSDALAGTVFDLGADALGLGSIGTAAEVGTAAAGTAEAGSVAAAGSAIWDALAAVVAWIICTELVKQGKMSKRFYTYGAKHFASYTEKELRGYYIWAIPAVKHLRAHPDSLFSKFLAYVFNARVEYIAHKAGCRTAKWKLSGAVATAGVYTFCKVLSYFVPAKDWRTVYGTV